MNFYEQMMALRTIIRKEIQRFLRIWDSFPLKIWISLYENPGIFGFFRKTSNFEKL